MSRSRKKFPMFSQRPGSMKGWKKSSNRTYRAHARTKLATYIAQGKDWDDFYVDDFDKYITWSDSPKDGFGRYHHKPLPDNCYQDYIRYAKYMWGLRDFDLDETGHHATCDCPNNPKTWPRSWYSKMFRK